MRILILTFYYPPDLSAGSFRVDAIIRAMRQLRPKDLEIDVVTTRPNRYSSFTADAPRHASENGLSVSRIPLAKHESGMLDQSRSFLGFARGTMREVRGKQYDLVFATSSRLMTAALAAFVARLKKARLYIDLRDIFADTIREIAPKPVGVLAHPFFSALERWTVGRASRVNLVSAGFADYFASRYPETDFSFFTNGIDDEFLAANPAAVPNADASDVLTILYAGNLGEGQGMHTIVPDLAERLRGRARFRIIGDGGRKRALESAIAERGIDNVEILPPLPRDALISAYRQADVLFLHLNDFPALKKVLPSKLFEYGAMGKPIWAGVDGYARYFIERELSNAAVFHPRNAGDALHAFQSLSLQHTARPDFVAKYSRAAISRQMAAEILETATGK